MSWSEPTVVGLALSCRSDLTGFSLFFSPVSSCDPQTNLFFRCAYELSVCCTCIHIRRTLRQHRAPFAKLLDMLLWTLHSVYIYLLSPALNYTTPPYKYTLHKHVDSVCMDMSYCVALIAWTGGSVVKSCPVLGPLSELCSPRIWLSCGVWANSSPLSAAQGGDM